MNQVEKIQEFDHDEIQGLQINELQNALKSEYFDDPEEIKDLVDDLNKNKNEEMKAAMTVDLVSGYESLMKEGKENRDLEDIKILQLYINIVLGTPITVDGKISDQMGVLLGIDFETINVQSVYELGIEENYAENIRDILGSEENVMLKRYIRDIKEQEIETIDEITIYNFFEPSDLIGLENDPEKRGYLAENLKMFLYNAMSLPDNKKYTNNLDAIAKDIALEKEAIDLYKMMITDGAFASGNFNFLNQEKDPYVISRALVYLRYGEKNYSYLYQSWSSDSVGVKTLEAKYNQFAEADQMADDDPNTIYLSIFLEYIQFQGNGFWAPGRENNYILDKQYINVEGDENTILIQNENIKKSPNIINILLNMKIGKDILKSSQEYYRNARMMELQPVYDVYNNALQLNGMLKKGSVNEAGEYTPGNLGHTQEDIRLLNLAEKNRSLNDWKEMKSRCIFTTALVQRSTSENHQLGSLEIPQEEKDYLEKNSQKFVKLVQLLNNEIIRKGGVQSGMREVVDAMNINDEEKETLKRLVLDNRRLINLYDIMAMAKIGIMDQETIERKEQEIQTANLLCDRYYHGKEIDPEIFFARYGASWNNQDRPSKTRINIINSLGKKVGTLEWAGNKVNMINITEETIQTAEHMRKENEEALNAYYMNTLLPIMNIVDINLSGYKNNLSYVEERDLVALSFMGRLNTDKVSAFGIDFTGVDESSLGGITKMYSEEFVRGLKKIYPKVAPTPEQFAEICPKDWDVSTWPMVMSPMSAVFGVPYMLDFSKYPDGEVVVPQSGTLGRMNQKFQDGEYRDFTKEVLSVVGGAAMTAIPGLKEAHWLIKGAVFYAGQKLTATGLNYGEMIVKSATGQEEYGSFWNAAGLGVGEAFNIYEVNPNTGEPQVDANGERIIKPVLNIIGEQVLEFVMGSILFTKGRGKASNRVAKGMQRPIVDKLAYGSISSFQAKFLTSIASLGAEATLFTALGIVTTPIQEGMMSMIKTGGDREASLDILGKTALSMIQPENVLDSFLHTCVFIGSLRGTHSVLSRFPKNKNYSKKQQKLIEENDKNLIEINKRMQKNGLESSIEGDKLKFFKKSPSGELIEVDMKAEYPDIHTMRQKTIEIGSKIQGLQDIIVKNSQGLKDHEYLQFCEKNLLNSGLEAPEKTIQERIDAYRKRGQEFEAQQWEKKLEELKILKTDFYAKAGELGLLEGSTEYNLQMAEMMNRNAIMLGEVNVSAESVVPNNRTISPETEGNAYEITRDRDGFVERIQGDGLIEKIDGRLLLTDKCKELAMKEGALDFVIREGTSEYMVSRNFGTENSEWYVTNEVILDTNGKVKKIVGGSNMMESYSMNRANIIKQYNITYDGVKLEVQGFEYDLPGDISKPVESPGLKYNEKGEIVTIKGDGLMENYTMSNKLQDIIAKERMSNEIRVIERGKEYVIIKDQVTNTRGVQYVDYGTSYDNRGLDTGKEIVWINKITENTSIQFVEVTEFSSVPREKGVIEYKVDKNQNVLVNTGKMSEVSFKIVYDKFLQTIGEKYSFYTIHVGGRELLNSGMNNGVNRVSENSDRMKKIADTNVNQKANIYDLELPIKKGKSEYMYFSATGEIMSYNINAEAGSREYIMALETFKKSIALDATMWGKSLYTLKTAYGYASDKKLPGDLDYATNKNGMIDYLTNIRNYEGNIKNFSLTTNVSHTKTGFDSIDKIFNEKGGIKPEILDMINNGIDVNGKKETLRIEYDGIVDIMADGVPIKGGINREIFVEDGTRQFEVDPNQSMQVDVFGVRMNMLTPEGYLPYSKDLLLSDFSKEIAPTVEDKLKITKRLSDCIESLRTLDPSLSQKNDADVIIDYLKQENKGEFDVMIDYLEGAKEKWQQHTGETRMPTNISDFLSKTDNIKQSVAEINKINQGNINSENINTELVKLYLLHDAQTQNGGERVIVSEDIMNNNVKIFKENLGIEQINDYRNWLVEEYNINIQEITNHDYSGPGGFAFYTDLYIINKEPKYQIMTNK